MVDTQHDQQVFKRILACQYNNGLKYENNLEKPQHTIDTVLLPLFNFETNNKKKHLIRMFN